MHQRPTLKTGEHRLVDLLDPFLAAHDETAARASQRLVRGAGYKVGPWHRTRVLATGHQPGNVRHIHHEQGTVALADIGKLVELNGPAVGAGPRYH